MRIFEELIDEYKKRAVDQLNALSKEYAVKVESYHISRYEHINIDITYILVSYEVVE